MHAADFAAAAGLLLWLLSRLLPLLLLLLLPLLLALLLLTLLWKGAVSTQQNATALPHLFKARHPRDWVGVRCYAAGAIGTCTPPAKETQSMINYRQCSTRAAVGPLSLPLRRFVPVS